MNKSLNICRIDCLRKSPEIFFNKQSISIQTCHPSKSLYLDPNQIFTACLSERGVWARSLKSTTNYKKLSSSEWWFKCPATPCLQPRTSCPSVSRSSRVSWNARGPHTTALDTWRLRPRANPTIFSLHNFFLNRFLLVFKEMRDLKKKLDTYQQSNALPLPRRYQPWKLECHRYPLRTRGGGAVGETNLLLALLSLDTPLQSGTGFE